MEFRPCGECAACCEGHLIGNSHGNVYGKGKPCVFLVQGLCSIYENRPDTCHKYFCGWSQHLLPSWMRPDVCGIMVSVETKEDGSQYLKAIEIREKIEQRVYRELKEAAQKLNAELVIVGYNNE